MHGASIVKVCASGGVLSLTDNVDSPQLTQAELDALVDEAHALGRKAAAHAHGAEAAKRALRAGIDSIEHGTFIDDEGLDLMKKRGAWLTFTPTLCLDERMKTNGAPPLVVAKAAAAKAREDAMFKRALQKGVNLAFGSDAAVCPHGQQLKQFAKMVSLGMKPLAAMRAATSGDARLFGVDGKVGSLESRQARRRRRRRRRSRARHPRHGAGRLRDEGRRRLQERARRYALIDSSHATGARHSSSIRCRRAARSRR